MAAQWLFPVVLGSITLKGSSLKCNGAEEFCDLPLDHFTFPETHNSGAFNLNPPASFTDKVTTWGLRGLVNGVLESGLVPGCLYDNHWKNYQQQLEDTGIRMFNVDICCKDGTDGGQNGGRALYNCHGPDKEMTGYGESAAASLLSIYQWMKMNPHEVVVWSLSDLGVDATQEHGKWAAEQIFGACRSGSLDLPGDAAATSAPLCLDMNQDFRNPDQKTLGNLIRSGYRFIYAHPKGIPHKGNYWGTANFVHSPEIFSDALETWANELEVVSADRSSNKPLNMVILDAFLSNNMDLLMAGEKMLECNAPLSKKMNEYLLIGDDVDPNEEFAPPDGTKCEGVKCAGYRSRLEVIHQIILTKGWTLAGVMIDYSRYGDVKALVHRINMANVRRRNGLLEPGIQFYELPWVIAIFITSLVLPCIIGLFYVCYKHPSWIPRDCRMCCCDCKRLKKKRRRKERKKDRQEDKQAQKQFEKEQASLYGNAAPSGGYDAGGYNAGVAPASGTYGNYPSPYGQAQANFWPAAQNIQAPASQAHGVQAFPPAPKSYGALSMPALPMGGSASIPAPPLPTQTMNQHRSVNADLE